MKPHCSPHSRLPLLQSHYHTSQFRRPQARNTKKPHSPSLKQKQKEASHHPRISNILSSDYNANRAKFFGSYKPTEEEKAKESITKFFKNPEMPPEESAKKLETILGKSGRMAVNPIDKTANVYKKDQRRFWGVSSQCSSTSQYISN
jgi:hypothetical protein